MNHGPRHPNPLYHIHSCQRICQISPNAGWRRSVRRNKAVHHMFLSFPLSNLDLLHISLTTPPSSLSSAPTIPPSLSTFSSPPPFPLALSSGYSPGFMIISTERPLHPAACLLFFTDKKVGLVRAGFRFFNTLAIKTASYRLRAAAGTGVGRKSVGWLLAGMLTLV